jgi:hypothetical protein
MRLSQQCWRDRCLHGIWDGAHGLASYSRRGAAPGGNVHLRSRRALNDKSQCTRAARIMTHTGTHASPNATHTWGLLGGRHTPTVSPTPPRSR